MYNFIVQIIFVASLAIIIFLFARGLPRIVDDTEDASLKFDAIDKFAEKIPLERFDNVIHVALEKWLRKIHLLILRFDSSVNRYLEQLKKYSQEKETKEDLKEKMDAIKGEKEED